METQKKQGYKHTELGWIPEEWEEVTIDKLVKDEVIFQPLDGNHGEIHPKKSDFVEYGIPFIMANNVQNGKVDLNSCNFIKKEQADSLRKGFSIAGDVLFTHKGTVGNVAILERIFTEYIMLTPQVTYYRIKDRSKLSNSFLRHIFQSGAFQTIVKNISGGGTRAYIGITSQRQLPIILPPLPEQQAIATALSDMDAYIRSLEQLIEKKKAIKQAAMQELLTPKEDWEVRKLGEVATMFSGGTPNTGNVDYYGGEIPWINSGDLNQKLIGEVSGRITEKGLKNSSAQLIKENTLLIALYGATAGVVAISRINAAINQAVLAIIPSKEFDYLFLYYLLDHLSDWIIVTFTQGGQPNLSGSIIKSIEVALPQLRMQLEISATLHDIDLGIISLARKLDKAMKVKQSMMQDLLTGKVRLV